MRLTNLRVRRCRTAESGERSDYQSDGDAEVEDVLAAVEINDDIDEAHRGDEDEHRHDAGLQVVQVVHHQPAGQMGALPSRVVAADEQLVEANGSDQQRGADQEQVDDEQEDPDPVFDREGMRDRVDGRPETNRRRRRTRRPQR